ncbi:hypothetical protein ACFPZ0_04175 [Streptomonospora nanhaiensis]|uniref:Conjugal transfer protein TrbC n=1 Tax=Streptomonospora nanhaiensis TaxID=1323731 RepID=A0A853BR50_9ACTN|nr:hypothetical protein [Streptomonospora nanhaiensis]MBV2362212.1 hypothetical protein [Streptomonospora nanhaiensis]MBX9390119.1 hypothetical protein [Streptomonospora nanhaiensis]NYI97334.1 hypothetical protein [Streptomonospora nanhaiensis]
MTDLLVAVAMAVPDPGGAEAPPGSEGLLAILRWVQWVALGVCLAGLMAAGAAMAIGARRGEGGEHMGRLGMVLGGVVVIAGATSLVSFLATA